MSKSKSLLRRLGMAVTIIFLIAVLTLFLARRLFPARYDDLIDKYCLLYDVDKSLVFSLIKAESNFYETAVSHAQAKGLMQLTESTFSYCIEKADFHTNPDIFDPEANIKAGIWYLSFLLDKYDGNIVNSVAAYNAGLSNVDKWLSAEEFSQDGKNLKVIPFPETDRHVGKIIRYCKIYDLLY